MRTNESWGKQTSVSGNKIARLAPLLAQSSPLRTHMLYIHYSPDCWIWKNRVPRRGRISTLLSSTALLAPSLRAFSKSLRTINPLRPYRDPLGHSCQSLTVKSFTASLLQRQRWLQFAHSENGLALNER